jgi:hypothetical protein
MIDVCLFFLKAAKRNNSKRVPFDELPEKTGQAGTTLRQAPRKAGAGR